MMRLPFVTPSVERRWEVDATPPSARRSAIRRRAWYKSCSLSLEKEKSARDFWQTFSFPMGSGRLSLMTDSSMNVTLPCGTFSSRTSSPVVSEVSAPLLSHTAIPNSDMRHLPVVDCIVLWLVCAIGKKLSISAGFGMLNRC